MRRILITSFSPFGERRVNSSERFATFAQKEELSIRFRCALEHRVLPVSWEKTKIEMRRALDEIQPHIVIAFGEAAIKEIHVEAQAHNFCHGRIVDNDGNLPPALKIIEGGAESLATQVDLLKIVNTLQQKNITCAVSHDAGSFLCNFLYYNLLLKEPVQGFHSLFVHIPVNWEASFSSVERFSDAAGKLLETVVAQALILERSCQ